jgi:hypothetical protein
MAQAMGIQKPGVCAVVESGGCGRVEFLERIRGSSGNRDLSNRVGAHDQRRGGLAESLIRAAVGYVRIGGAGDSKGRGEGKG